jgi:hypothetical protein
VRHQRGHRDRRALLLPRVLTGDLLDRLDEPDVARQPPAEEDRPLRADRADELLDSSIELAEIAQGDQRVLRLKAALDRVRCDAGINERDASALALHAIQLRDLERALTKEVETNP